MKLASSLHRGMIVSMWRQQAPSAGPLICTVRLRPTRSYCTPPTQAAILPRSIDQEQAIAPTGRLSVLEKLLEEGEQSSQPPPTRTEIVTFLETQDIDYLVNESGRFVRTDCAECGSQQTSLISAIDGEVTCTICHHTQPFVRFKKRVTTVRKTETTCDEDSSKSEDQRLLETLKKMENPDELDSDLYDQVSYLNLMSQYKEKQNTKKADRMTRARDENQPASMTWIDMDDFLILPEPHQVPLESESDEDVTTLRNEASFLGDSFDYEEGLYGEHPIYAESEAASSDAPSPRVTSEDVAGMSGPSPPDPHVKYLWNESVELSDLVGLEQTDMMQLRVMLGVERISLDTLARYNVRGHMDGYDQPAVLYPRYRGMTSRLRVPAGLKVIRKIGDSMEKENYPLQDETSGKQRFSGIFGYHMMTASDRAVVLTTNERDALAVYEATDGALAFALPQGERVDSSVFPYLEDFDQIFIWFPSRHLEFAKEWGCALNGSRCFLIKYPERPIELVRSHKNKDVKMILSQKAVRIRDKGFRSMTDIRDEVKADLVHSSSRQLGLAQWKRFSALNKYLMGFRPGELTVLTGGTGFGKTTFLCEYALDLFTQGVRTLFCSFEMPEEKILKWMLVQFAGLPLYRVEFSNSIDNWLDKFERTKGPLTIMKTDEFAEKSINQIALAIRNQVVNSGCQHVVIDNLQFLVNQTTLTDDQSSSFDRFHHQDRFVGLMRKLASEHQVHITMVVHPRKTDSDTDLDMQHFGGSARVTQEADNVLAIQKRKDDKGKPARKFLYILKSRYGGRVVESDQLEMVFQPATYSHTLVDHSRVL